MEVTSIGSEVYTNSILETISQKISIKKVANSSTTATFKPIKTETMTTVNVYLNFDGNCEEAFNFYKSVFGGEFKYLGKFKEMPTQEGTPPLPKEMEERIMHVFLPISQETSLFGSDTGGEWGPAFRQGNNFSISISTDRKEEADRLFNGLSAGGVVSMPMADTFWGDYFGTFADKFGINWLVGFTNPQEK